MHLKLPLCIFQVCKFTMSSFKLKNVDCMLKKWNLEELPYCAHEGIKTKNETLKKTNPF